MGKTIKNGLKALVCEEPHILILGTLPSDTSIAANEYYANPKNFFWKIIAAITGAPEPSTYNEKKNMLAANHIALWDVYAAADRKGSLDSAIKEGEFNDISSVIKRYPSITKIIFNGNKSAKAFNEYIKNCTEACTMERTSRQIMPSTSPMVLCSGITFNELVEKWRSIFG